MQSVSKKVAHFLYSVLTIIPLLSYGYFRIFNHSSSSSMGVFAYADAAGYKSCIESLSIFGTFGNAQEFCFRRPIYPFVGGLILKIANDPLLVPLVFSIIFSISILFLVIELVNFFDFFPIMFSVLFLNFQWHQFASISFTTESLGLILGVIATVLIFRSIRLKLWTTYFCAGIFIGLSQLVRPGNIFLFLIPCIFIPLHHLGREVIWKKSLIIFSSAIPLLFIRLVANILNVTSLNSSANFWGVLYGLSDGNKTWAEAYTLPGIQPSMNDSQIWRVVRETTIQNIHNNPIEFVGNIFINVWRYIEYRLTFVNSVFQDDLIGLSDSLYFTTVSLIFLSVVYFLFLSTVGFRVFYLFVLVTTIVTFGIFYNAEAYRTISTFHFLFILIVVNSVYVILSRMILTAKSIASKSKAFERVNKTIVNDNSVQDQRENVFVSRMKFTSLVLIMCISLGTFFGVSQSKESIPGPARLCSNASVYDLRSETLQIVDLRSIEKPPQYLWSPILKRLEPGVLLHGIYRDGTGLILTINAYLPNNLEDLRKMMSSGGCLKIVPDVTPDRNLWIVGLKLAVIDKLN